MRCRCGTARSMSIGARGRSITTRCATGRSGRSIRSRSRARSSRVTREGATPPPPRRSGRLAAIRFAVHLHLPDLALDVPFVAVDLEEAFGELDRFGQRRRFEDRVTADHLAGLRERTIGAAELAVVVADADAFG